MSWGSPMFLSEIWSEFIRGWLEVGKESLYVATNWGSFSRTTFWPHQNHMAYKVGMVNHGCDPNTWVAEVRGKWVLGHPGLFSRGQGRVDCCMAIPLVEYRHHCNSYSLFANSKLYEHRRLRTVPVTESSFTLHLQSIQGLNATVKHTALKSLLETCLVDLEGERYNIHDANVKYGSHFKVNF